MLSEGQKLTEKRRLQQLPVLERPLTVRLKFRKVGSLQYISHLDLQRTFNRVITRACIPVWYTKGFNPHAKLVFSAPLSVGTQSKYEFLDIRIERNMDCSEIMNRMNAELTEELRIEEAYIPSTDFSEIAWASYEMVLHCQNVSSALINEIQNTLTVSPLLLTKKTKAGEKEIDIIPMIRIRSVAFDDVTKNINICAILKASSSEFLNPEMVITALKQKLHLFENSPLEEWYTIMRTSVLNADGSLFR